MDTKSWHNLYKTGWGKELTPEAFSHPAKINRGLARKIYAYAIERGWLKEGDVCLDPFAGICGFALDAMFHGLHFIGCELEEKFVSLGQQNIDLWNRRYGNGKLRRWGTAVILQGDSRRLVEVLEGARAEGIIASPPFAESQQVDNRKKMPSAMSNTWRKRFGQITGGTDPANLGNMPTGEPPQAIITSPPYATQTVHDRCSIDPDKLTGNPPGPHSQALTMANYGDSDGQLGAMREGDVDAVIASPPFADSQQAIRADFVLDSTKVNPTPRKLGDRSYFPAEMESDGQLAALPEGEPPQVDGIVASPPYAKSNQDYESGWSYIDKDKLAASSHDRDSRQRKASYGDQPGQLGQMKEGEPPAGIVQVDACVSSPPYECTRTIPGGDESEIARGYGDSTGRERTQEAQNTFWSAARAILLQCHQVLAPGGIAIWVLKAFVRNKAIVDFPGQWEALCNSCGFETIEVIRAWLVEDRGAQFALNGELVEKKVARKSFFRRLYEWKARAAKFWLSVPRSEQATYLWQAHNWLWQEYNKKMGSPEPSNIRPTRTRITSAAQVIAYKDAGEPNVETDTQIDWEVVLVTRKGAA